MPMLKKTRFFHRDDGDPLLSSRHITTIACSPMHSIDKLHGDDMKGGCMLFFGNQTPQVPRTTTIGQWQSGYLSLVYCNPAWYAARDKQSGSFCGWLRDTGRGRVAQGDHNNDYSTAMLTISNTTSQHRLQRRIQYNKRGAPIHQARVDTAPLDQSGYGTIRRSRITDPGRWLGAPRAPLSTPSVLVDPPIHQIITEGLPAPPGGSIFSPAKKPGSSCRDDSGAGYGDVDLHPRPDHCAPGRCPLPLGSGSGQTTISHCSSASIEQQNVRDHIVLHTADKRETTTSDNRAQQCTLPRHICTPAAHKKPGFFVVSRVALPSTLPPTPNKQPTQTSHRVQSALRCNVAYAQSLLGFQWCAAQRVQFQHVFNSGSLQCRRLHYYHKRHKVPA